MVIKIDGVKIGSVDDYITSNIIQSKKILKQSEVTSDGVPAKPPEINIQGGKIDTKPKTIPEIEDIRKARRYLNKCMDQRIFAPAEIGYNYATPYLKETSIAQILLRE